jgi:hypothetical protein
MSWLTAELDRLRPIRRDDAAVTLKVTKYVGILSHQCGPDCAFPDFEHLPAKPTDRRTSQPESKP